MERSTLKNIVWSGTAIALACVAAGIGPWPVLAQAGRGRGNAPAVPPAPAAKPAVEAPPVDYVIGPGDVLAIGLYGEDRPGYGGDFTVRPDGKVTLFLVNEVQASGLTTEQFRERLTAAFRKFYEEPAVLLTVRQINSRIVFIQGAVSKPGGYPLNRPLTVMQFIALAGGLTEYANRENIVIIRHSEKMPNGNSVSFRLNYTEVLKRRNLNQDILLKADDQVIVPE